MGPKSKLIFFNIFSYILMSYSSKPWCMHLGRILAVKGIKVGDVITKRCLVHHSVRSTREEDKV